MKKIIVTVDDRMGMRFLGRPLSRDSVLDERIKPLISEGYERIEKASDVPKVSEIEAIAVYRWNRKYPSDELFTADLSGFTLKTSADFPGSSHEKITEEIYEK